MPRPKAKRLGVGAIAQCKAKFLKPKKTVKKKYPNTYDEEVISNLNVLGKEKKIVVLRSVRMDSGGRLGTNFILWA